MDYSYKKVKENIKENSFVIKKKFGQNFIIDNNIAPAIINAFDAFSIKNSSLICRQRPEAHTLPQRPMNAKLPGVFDARELMS